MKIMKKIYKQSVFILAPAALISALFEWQKTPLSILTGGVLCLANLKGLVWGVEGLMGTQGATSKLLFLSFTRFLIIVAILLILVWLRLINMVGVLIGFTLVFILLLKEGVRTARDEGLGQ
ncbi:MAG: ATP synthase subunit I [Nitrospirae bacterium]|nr:ATP synthase subunit I [Nitrospirota bacterium]